MSARLRVTALPVALAALTAAIVAPLGAQTPAEPASPVEGSHRRLETLLVDAANAMAAVYDYRGIILKRELFGDELVEQKIAFKFSRPFRVYVKYLDPHEGREGLYVRGRNRNRLRAHRGSPPDITANLNPRGRIAMIDNHHPITSFGLENMLKIATRNIEKAIARGDATLTISNGGLIRGEPTWRIDMETNAGGFTVKARRGETLWDIARRTKQDMHVILHHNEGIESPDDVSAGQDVFIPHYYASRGVYFFSQRTYMLILTASWDHRGRLYEWYEYPDLELNPRLDDRDFDHRNKAYEFVKVNQR